MFRPPQERTLGFSPSTATSRRVDGLVVGHVRVPCGSKCLWLTTDRHFDQLLWQLETGGAFNLLAAIGVPPMCDYSLHLTASRPARVGDKLVSTRFPDTITRGFASLEERNVAVCLLPGTELAFEEEVACETRSMFRPQRELGYKMATFRQINKDRSDTHHDALEFSDGQVVLLTQLCEGQHATVLQVPASLRVASGKAQKHDSLAV